MPKSRLLKITDYALIEIIYSDDSANSSKYGFKIVDNSIEQYRSFFNSDASSSKTGNVLDRSSVQLGSRQWVRTEQDIPIRYLPTDSRFTVNDLSEVIEAGQQWEVSYDTIRVHILSGYTFTSSSGFVLEVLYPEKNKLKSARAASLTYVNGDDYIIFNTRPLVINGVNYDKYIEFKIPSLDELITNFDSATTKSDALAYYLTSDNGGFLTDGLIGFNFHEIEQVNNFNGFDYLSTTNDNSSSIEPKDLYADLAAVIVQNGDYFEYYPTWKGEFIADYIQILRETLGNYVVIHELTITEQVGFSEVYNASNVILQREDFNQPSLYRPILKNSDTSFSFSIDYVMRLTNEDNGTQIIRTASVTSFEPKRFGKSIAKLTVGSDVSPLKIYNVVTEGPKFSSPVPTTLTKIQRIVSPSFYDFTNVSVTTGKLFISNANELVPDNLFEWDVVFGQSEAIIILNPFDNYFRFRVYRSTPQELQHVDLSEAQEINIVFESSNGSRHRYALYQPYTQGASVNDGLLVDPKTGVLTFRVPASDSASMLESMPGKFFLTVRNKNTVRARVSLDISNELRGKEVVIPFQEWSQKSEYDLITVYYNLNPYTIEKRYLDVLEILADGNTGEETVIYRGNVESMDNYQKVLDNIDNLRSTAFKTRLDSIKQKESSLDARERGLNNRESELNSKEASLKSLETALLGQQQTLQSQTASLKDQQTELDRRNALLKQREADLKAQADDAKKRQSDNVKELSDVINSLRQDIERLKGPQGSTTSGGNSTTSGGGSSSGGGNQGSGNQGNQGTGNQGNQGAGNQGNRNNQTNSQLNIDRILNQSDFFQNPQTKSGTTGYKIGQNLGNVKDIYTSSGVTVGSNLTGGEGLIPTSETSTYVVAYDVYYVNTPTFVGRYEIRSTTTIGVSRDALTALYNKEFVGDRRTNGGKYTELKKNQPRTFQSNEIAYKSKWVIEKENTNDTSSSQGGIVQKPKVALIEFDTKGLDIKRNIASPVTIMRDGVDVEVTSRYSNTFKLKGAYAIRAEIVLNDLYYQGVDERNAGKNTYLAGYSRYIDTLTKETYDKDIPKKQVTTNGKSSTQYNLKGLIGEFSYTNTLLDNLQTADVTNTAEWIKTFVEDSSQFITFASNPSKKFYGWDAIFEILVRENGIGNFSYTLSKSVQPTLWVTSLAKLYDTLLNNLFGLTAQQLISIQQPILLVNQIIEQVSASKLSIDNKQNVKYIRVTRKVTPQGLPYQGIGSFKTSSFYVLQDIQNDFVEREPEIQVFSGEVFTKELPMALTLTLSGKTFSYSKLDAYQVSDYISGLPPNTVRGFL